MSKRKNNIQKDATVLPTRNRGVPLAVVRVLAVVIVASLGCWWWKTKHTSEPPPPSPPTEVITTAVLPGAAGPSRADFQKLKGKWLRPDGGYVLEIRAIGETGKLDASYLNPRPINVSKAEASPDGETVKVFLELRDVNYPGSNYDLTYDPQSDSLKGIYYQATLRQRFEVVFVRMN